MQRPPRKPPDTKAGAGAPGPQLTARLPNAPAAFVGRAAEVQWLKRALRRGPLAVVCGEGGAGKSALVRSALHALAHGIAERAVYVSMRSADAGEPLALPLLRALSQADGQTRVDWPELLASGDGLSAHALTLAERGERWVVLDDLHLARPDDVASLLGVIARYGKRSRFVATLRARPSDQALSGLVLPLGPLPSRDAAQLARRLSPSIGRDEAERLARRSGGSPWTLARLVRLGDASPLASPESLERLSPAEAAVLEALSLASVPVPDACAERAARAPEGTVEELCRRGLLERSEAGALLLEQPPAQGSEAAPDEARRLASSLGEELSGRGEPALQVAAVRLLASSGKHAEARSLLEQRGEALLASGHGPGLWAALSGTLSPSLDRFRLEAALELGDAQAQAVREPASREPQVRVLWARLLLSRGRAEEALQAATEAASGAERAGEGEVLAEARLIAARALCNQGRLREGLERLGQIEPEGSVGAMAEALAANALCLLGERERASDIASSLLERLGALPWPLRGRVGYNLGFALYHLGHLREAASCLDQAAAERGAATRFDAGRQLRFLRVCLSVDGGELDRARAQIDALEPYVGPRSLLRPHLLLARAVALLAHGSTDEAGAIWLELSSGERSSTFRQELEALGLKLSTLRAEPPRTACSPGEGALFGRQTELLALERALRSGELSPSEALSRLGGREAHPELSAIAGRVRAEARLLGGDQGGALSAASEAAAEAREHGFLVACAEALELKSDAALSLGNPPLVRASAGELLSLAEAMPSPRFRASASLALALAPPHDGAASVAEAASSLGDLPASRRARALLGGDVRLDAADRLLLARVEELGWFRAPERVTAKGEGGDRAGQGWGLDEARLEVWLPGGRRISMGNQLMQFRLLASLARAGGRAGKEQLVREVWGEGDYHPLRHDNRLHALVRKLRQRLEDDPSSPTRLLTTDDGYALAGAVRRVGG